MIVVDRASVPKTYVSPRVELTVTLAVLLGLLLNCALALLAEYLADPLPGSGEMEPVFGLPVLAAIPPLSFPKTTVDRDSLARVRLGGVPARAPAVRADESQRRVAPSRRSPVVADARVVRGLIDVRSPSAEPFRMLRLAVDLRPRENRKLPIVFTSASAGEGKSTVAANYALVAAQNERRVLLIDADLRKPIAAQAVRQVECAPGLTEVIAADMQSRDVVKPIQENPGVLHLLTAGTPLPNAGDVVGSSRMATLFASMAEEYDLVVVDSPPVLAASDAATMASHTGADIAFVVGKGTRKRTVTRALGKLDLVGVNVLGFVMNREGEPHGVRLPLGRRARGPDAPGSRTPADVAVGGVPHGRRPRQRCGGPGAGKREGDRRRPPRVAPDRCSWRSVGSCRDTAPCLPTSPWASVSRASHWRPSRCP